MDIRFEAFMAVKIHIVFFWDMKPGCLRKIQPHSLGYTSVLKVYPFEIQ
jgi:hypothetical protein